MRTMDLTKLIEGLLIVILFACLVGKYDRLRSFAAQEAVASLHGWDQHLFSPSTYRELVGTPSKGQVHLKGAVHSRLPSRSDQLNFLHKGTLQPISKIER